MKNIDITIRKHGLALLGIALFGFILIGSMTNSQATIVHGQTTDVRVWVENEDEIYPDIDDVVFYIRAARGCHALVYIVDTDGYIHVLHPFSMYDDAWIDGGVTYRITAREAGLYGLGYDRGIAFVYAVGSPYPFEYSAYGASIFAGGFGFRIYGDPFIASKRFYVSLLPSWCDRTYIGVSYSHFYLREWVRYPRYLCVNHSWSYHDHGYCNRCSHVYDRYRVHMRDPYRVIHPKVRYKGGGEDYARIASVPSERREALRAKRAQANRPVKASHKSLEGRSLRDKKVHANKPAPRVKSAPPKTKRMHDLNGRPAPSRKAGKVTRKSSREMERVINKSTKTTKNRSVIKTRSTKRTTKTNVRKPTTQSRGSSKRTTAIKQRNGKTEKRFSKAVKPQSRSKSGRVISKASKVKKSSRKTTGRVSSKSGRNRGK